MDNNVYKLTDVVGTSQVSIDDAIRHAIERTRESIRNVRWFEVLATRGFIALDGTIQYQVTMKIGFTLE